MMAIRSAKAQGGKQMDIRNMFSKKAKKETEAGEKDVLKRYKVEYTSVFAAVSNAGKNALVPPFLPLDEMSLQGANE